MVSTFRALAETVVPEAKELDREGWRELQRIVDDALAARPAKMRRQLRLFVGAINVLPLFRFGRTFCALDPRRRAAFLLRLQNAPLLLIRSEEHTSELQSPYVISYAV